MLGFKEDAFVRRWYYIVKNSHKYTFHCIKAPSYIRKGVYRSFFVAGKKHNLNSWAFRSTRREEYLLAGEFHNISGPAIVKGSYSADQFFYINGTVYSESDYNRILKVSDASA